MTNYWDALNVEVTRGNWATKHTCFLPFHLHTDSFSFPKFLHQHSGVRVRDVWTSFQDKCIPGARIRWIDIRWLDIVRCKFKCKCILTGIFFATVGCSDCVKYQLAWGSHHMRPLHSSSSLSSEPFDKNHDAYIHVWCSSNDKDSWRCQSKYSVVFTFRTQSLASFIFLHFWCEVCKWEFLHVVYVMQMLFVCRL